MVKTHRDLQIWQKSMGLVTDVYQAVENFPDYEKFGLMSQLEDPQFLYLQILLKDLAGDHKK